MTLIPAKHKIAPAALLITAMAACLVPSLRAQSRLPSQGGLAPNSLPAPLSAANTLSPDPGPSAPDAAFPSSLAGDMPDDGAPLVPPIVGTIDGKDYVAPTGAYRIRIPVYPELGGQINDTENVVTFQDAYGDHSSIGCFPMDNDLRLQEAKGSRKDFLVWFFQNYIQADFQRNIPGTSVMPDAKFNPNAQGGALFTQMLLPDGSVYTERVFLFPPNPPLVAKRGNLVFERDGLVYVLSMELTERIFQHDTWKKTDAEEEQILRERLYDLLSRIVFTKPKPGAATPAAPGVNPPAPATTGTASGVPTVSYPAPSTTGAGGASK